MSRDDIIYFQVTRTESNRIFQGTDSFGISHALLNLHLKKIHSNESLPLTSIYYIYQRPFI